MATRHESDLRILSIPAPTKRNATSVPVPAVMAATTPEMIQSRTSLRSVSRASAVRLRELRTPDEIAPVAATKRTVGHESTVTGRAPPGCEGDVPAVPRGVGCEKYVRLWV